MRSSPLLIKSMNEVLAEELAVIDEMKDTGILISRILFLEGKPVASELKRIHLGKDLTQVFFNDQANSIDDFTSREILGDFISDANSHIEVIEKNLDTISRLTLE